MLRSRVIRRVGLGVVALLVTSQMASSQALKPDAHGFLIAAQEEIKAADGGRSVTIVGDASKPGIYVHADHVGAEHRQPAALSQSGAVHHGASRAPGTSRPARTPTSTTRTR